MDDVLKVPMLLSRDMIAEKLLANADRCMDGPSPIAMQSTWESSFRPAAAFRKMLWARR